MGGPSGGGGGSSVSGAAPSAAQRRPVMNYGYQGHEGAGMPRQATPSDMGPGGMYLLQALGPKKSGQPAGKGGQQVAKTAAAPPRPKAVYENVKNPKPWALK